MKKTLTLLGMAAALWAATSCSKSEMDIQEPEIPSATESVKVNISVSSLTPDTKAVKTGWESGDIFNVYLDDATNYVPDFTLTYDGSSWNASALDDTVVARLKTSGGTLRGFWEGSNSCMSDEAWQGNYTSITFPNFPNFNSTGVTGYIVAAFNSIPYTYSEGTLTASINKWEFGNDLQIVVSGLIYSPGRYTLYSNAILNPRGIDMKIPNGDYQVRVLHWTNGSNGRMAGIENEDGVAFVGHIEGNGTKDYVFNLLDNNTGTVYTFKKESLSLDSSDGRKLLAIKIPFSKFYVDLGLSVKWAACNLGASVETDFGDYYAWGETEPYYLAGHAYDNPCVDWKDGKSAGYEWASYKFKDGWDWLRYSGSDYDTLLPEDDAAHASCGGAWRMPTHQEWQELASSCSWVWKTTADGFANNGYLITSNVAGYESNSIFLPAAGRRGSTYFDNNPPDWGNYWSSSIAGTSGGDVEKAKAPDFYSNSISLNNVTTRYTGLPIRSVIAD